MLITHTQIQLQYTTLHGSIQCKIKLHFCNYCVSNISGLLHATEKQKMWMRYRYVKEVNFQHQEHGS
jgi:hypothetical protein